MLDYLDAVFEANLLHIDDYVDVWHNPKAMKEVGRMNGLGDSIYERYERGVSQGIAQGISQGFDLFGRLINLLLEAGRVDDAKRLQPIKQPETDSCVSLI